MFLLKTVIFANSLFYIVDTAFVNNFKKCNIKDDSCMKLLHARFIHKYAVPGLPEFEIPSLDPMELNNITVPLFDNMFSITISNGVIEGIRNCIFDSVNIDIEDKTSSVEVTCDLIVKGKMGLSGISEELQRIFGKSSTEIQGNGQLKIDKINYKYITPLQIFKKDDGETHLKIVLNKTKYVINGVQKMSFSGKDFFLGEADISPIVVAYFNSNWKAIAKAGGDQFLTKSMDQYLVYVNNFFVKVPTALFIAEDLTPYL